MRRTAALVVGLIYGCGPGEKDLSCEDSELFDPDRIIEVRIAMADDDFEALQNETRTLVDEFSGDCRSEPFESDYTYFPADLSIAGERAGTIGIRKKGFIGSQSTLKPSFRLNLDEYIDDEELFCTDNITLNNAIQDPTLIRQCLAYDVFRDAGIAAPRCNLAFVYMNETPLGFYVNVEPVKKKFLRDHFGEDKGSLYEGTIADFTATWLSTFEPKTDQTDESLDPIVRLAADLDAKSEPLAAVLDRYFDVDELLTFLAVETWIGHSDGYGGNQNNFFVYVNDGTGKMHLIPWGVDGTFMPWLNDPENPWFPQRGWIIQRILADQMLSNRLYDRIEELNGTVWNATDLQSKVNRWSELIREAAGSGIQPEALRDVTDFIASRAAAIESSMPVAPPEQFAPPSCMHEIGTLEADFSTAWSPTPATSLEEIMASGTADLRLTWEDYRIPMRSTGAFAGPTEEEYSNVMVLGEFEGENGTAYALPIVYLEESMIVNGLEVNLDWGAGQLMYMDATTEGGFVPIAELWEGSMILDEASPVAGSVITGELFSPLFIWEEATQ